MFEGTCPPRETQLQYQRSEKTKTAQFVWLIVDLWEMQCRNKKTKNTCNRDGKETIIKIKPPKKKRETWFSHSAGGYHDGRDGICDAVIWKSYWLMITHWSLSSPTATSLRLISYLPLILFPPSPLSSQHLPTSRKVSLIGILQGHSGRGIESFLQYGLLVGQTS